MVREVIDPPQYQSTVQVTRTYRFLCVGAFNGYITFQNLAGIAGAMCTTANSSLTHLAGGWKFHSIKMWVQAASNGVGVTASINTLTVNGLPSREITNISANPARPTFISMKPQSGELLFLREGNQSATNAFGLLCPVGTIIDVHMTHWLYDIGTAGQTYTVAAGTLGALYYTPLDGSTDSLIPVGLPTTT